MSWSRMIPLAQSLSVIERQWWQSASGMPIWLGSLIAVLLLVLLARLYFYSSTPVGNTFWMWLCRMTAIGACLLAVTDLTRHKAVVELPVLVIAIDTSQSCSFADHYSDSAWETAVMRRLADVGLPEATRIAHAQLPWLESGGSLYRRLTKRYRLEFYAIGSSARIVRCNLDNLDEQIRSLSASDNKSEIGNCLNELIAQQVPEQCAGIILFSDGAVTAGASIESAAKRATALGIPIHCVGLGNAHRPPDVELSEFQSSDKVLVGNQLEITVRLSAVGLAGQTCQIKLLGGQAQELESREIVLDSNSVQQQVKFQVPIQIPGTQVIQVESQPLDSEVNVANNVVAKSIEAIKRELRVLLISQVPTPEVRFLKQALLRATNPNDSERLFQLEALTFESSANIAEVDDSAIQLFPVDQQRLNQYDVVILADVRIATGSDRGLTGSDLDALRHYVVDGHGALVMIAGPDYLPQSYFASALGELLPFKNAHASGSQTAAPGNAYRLALTQLGNRFEAAKILGEIENAPITAAPAPIRWIYAVKQIKPTALELCEFQSDSTTYPAITFQPFGSGVIVFHFTDETYRLRFRSQIDWFEKYWIQLVRYLGKSRIDRQGRGARLVTDKQSYREGEDVKLRAEIIDKTLVETNPDLVTITIESEEGIANPLTLSRDPATPEGLVYEGRISNLKPSRYVASLVTEELSDQSIDVMFEIERQVQEMIDLRLQLDALQAASAISEGQYVSIQQVDRLWNNLPPAGWTQISRLPAEPIWTGRWVPSLFAVLIIVLLTSEWIMRRRARLL